MLLTPKDGHDQQEERRRQPVPKRQDHDGSHEARRHRVVEDHQPKTPLAVEQRAGDRA